MSAYFYKCKGGCGCNLPDRGYCQRCSDKQERQVSEQSKLAACACGGVSELRYSGGLYENAKVSRICSRCEWMTGHFISEASAAAEWNRVMGACAALREIAGATLNRSDTSAAMVGQILAKHGVKFDV